MILKSLACMLILCVGLVGFAPPAFALIFGSEDSSAVERDDWPAGAAAIFNVRERVAYWEGPPLGGGQFHSECRGDTKVLNELLVLFGQVKSDNKRIVVEDGIGQSFWLNTNRDQPRRKRAEIDWTFEVWSQGSWDQLKQLPADLNPTSPEDREKGPPCELTIYTGGNIEWENVKLPEGVAIVDNRLVAHGFSVEDGYVAQGTLLELGADKPLAGEVYLEAIETSEQGGYQYTRGFTSEVAADGSWTLKRIEPGWYRIVATSPGYLSRVVGYVRPDGQPRFQSIDSRLVKGETIRGRVTDPTGNPLEGASVQLYNVAPPGGARYETLGEYETTTDQEGKFEIVAPAGSARVGLRKDGWVLPGLGPEIAVPVADLEVQMQPAASLTVIVLFETTEVPAEYMVELTPEGGNVVGSWGGTATMDDKNQVMFRNIPPGRYTLVGHPNPSTDDQKTPPMEIDLQGGEETTKTITVTK